MDPGGFWGKTAEDTDGTVEVKSEVGIPNSGWGNIASNVNVDFKKNVTIVYTTDWWIGDLY